MPHITRFFQNVMKILEELHIFVTPDQEYNKIFQDIPLIRFWKDKSLKDCLIRAKLPSIEETGRSESCWKRKRQVCDFICDTNSFLTKACNKIFKIHCKSLNCTSQKVVCLLKCSICGDVLCIGKEKTNFRSRFNNYERVHWS